MKSIVVLLLLAACVSAYYINNQNQFTETSNSAIRATVDGNTYNEQQMEEVQVMHRLFNPITIQGESQQNFNAVIRN